MILTLPPPFLFFFFYHSSHFFSCPWFSCEMKSECKTWHGMRAKPKLKPHGWMNFKQGLKTCKIGTSLARTGEKKLGPRWLCQMFWKYTLISYILNYIDWNSKLKPTYHISSGQKWSVKTVFWIPGWMHSPGFEVWQPGGFGLLEISAFY